MPNVLQKCEIVLHAVDTLIFNISETDEECQINLKFDFNNVNKCLKMNKLKLDEDKHSTMNSNSDMEINNKIREKVKKILNISVL